MNAEEGVFTRKALADCTNNVASRNSLSSSSSSKPPPASFSNVSIPRPHASNLPKIRLSPPKSSSLPAHYQRRNADKSKNKGKAVDILLASISADDPSTPHPQRESLDNPANYLRQSSEKSKNTGNTVDAPLTSIDVVDPSSPQGEFLDNPGIGDCEVVEPLTVYSRRQPSEKRKNKGKAVVVPLSCPPAKRITRIGDTIGQPGNIGLSKSAIVSRPKHKKLRRLHHEQDVSQHMLPQDFIQQQRAYFAEIDAFELPEEVVSGPDSE